MSSLRGHKVVEVDGVWYYEDTMETVSSTRLCCGHCGLSDTPEGHDGCLGTLPGVMNACCGHGVVEDAYIQYWPVRGEQAIKEQNDARASINTNLDL